MEAAEQIGVANANKDGLMPSSQFLTHNKVFANVAITDLTDLPDGFSFQYGAGTSIMPTSNGAVFKFCGYNGTILCLATNENATNIYIRMKREGHDSGWKAI